MKSLSALTLAAALLLSAALCPLTVCAAPETDKTVDILFTHDTHSHVNSFTTILDDWEVDVGGFARMNTLIQAQKAQNPDTLILDGGDFSMGTLIQTVFETQAAELQDDQLYRVVADLYSGQMLSAVTEMSYGILSIVPKYADGTPITDFEDVILTKNGRELKAWDAIARYMASFEDTDGNDIPNVPAYYSTTHGRKEVDDSKNIVALLKNPNRFTAMFVGVLLAALVLVVLFVLLIRRLVKVIWAKGKKDRQR